MTEERFEDLVNLYLDNEIGRHELEELKRVIKENIARRKQFERACQLHQAARKALVSRGDGARTTPIPTTPTPEGRSSSGGSSRSSGRKALTLEQMQERARLNATVPVLAERQAAQGVAATVNVSEVSKGRRRTHSRSSFSTSKTINFQGKLLLAGFVVAMGAVFLYFAPGRSGDQEGGYSPDVPEFPVTGPGTKAGGPGNMANAAEGVDGQMVTADDWIKARLMATAMTGNSVTGPMVEKLLEAQAAAGGPPVVNGTQQFSYSFTQRIYVQSDKINVPPVGEELQKTLGGKPANAMTGPAPGPMTPPGEIPEATSRTTTSTITIIVPMGGPVTPLNSAKGNDTLGNDLQP